MFCGVTHQRERSTPFPPVSPFLQQSLSECLRSSSLYGSPRLLPVPLVHLTCNDFPCSALGCGPQVRTYPDGSTKAHTPRSHPPPFLFPTLLFRWLPRRVTQRSEWGQGGPSELVFTEGFLSLLPPLRLMPELVWRTCFLVVFVLVLWFKAWKIVCPTPWGNVCYKYQNFLEESFLGFSF